MLTELRVHGVSGTSAEEMLDRPLLRQVAGDGNAGFFRPRVEYGATTGPGGAQLEAYRWGNLTAGTAARALWLLLLPFMLANVPIWLRPKTGPRAASLIKALCRIFALTVTATFVLAFVEISVDLVGWQCGALASCLRDRPYFGVLADGFFATPTRRLAVTGLVPMLAVGVLWILGRRTWSRYEAYPVGESGAGDGLAHPCFWNGKPLVGRLRSIHIGAAFATVDVALLGAVVPHLRDAWGAGLSVAAGLLCLLTVVAVCVTPMMDRDNPDAWPRRAARALSIVAVLLTLLVYAYLLAPRPDWRTGGGLPGLGRVTTGLFAGQVGLLLGLALVIVLSRTRGTTLYGLAAPMVASTGLGVAVAFASGMAYRVADFLDRDGVPSAPGVQTLEPPASFEWSALGFSVLLVLVIVVVLSARLPLTRRLCRDARAVTDAEFAGGRDRDAGRAEKIDTAIADARLTDHLPRLLSMLFAPMAVLSVACTALASAGYRPAVLAGGNPAGAELVSFTVNLGTYLIGFAALALIVLGVLAYRHQRLRRVVGVAWDLGTFWPRAAHPLAPPCYAERVVPELVKRTTWLATEQGSALLSGHSQGSILLAATVLQLPPEAHAGTALLTYGSPLRRLYARFFPAYVDDSVIDQVGTLLADPATGEPRWVNLWRQTDPIGGRVDGPAEDVRFLDPAGFDLVPGDTFHPHIDGHSNYQLRQDFAGAVIRAARCLPDPAPAAPLPLAPQPGTPEPPQPESHPPLPTPEATVPPTGVGLDPGPGTVPAPASVPVQGSVPAPAAVPVQAAVGGVSAVEPPATVPDGPTGAAPQGTTGVAPQRTDAPDPG